MDLNLFDRLGARLQTQFRRRNYDERRFSELAEIALRDLETDYEWRPELFADFLRDSPVMQDPDNEFSNFPLIVYRCQEFYIQILVWTSGTTAIHGHSFSGAFKVLEGSSLHTSYRFRELDSINSRLCAGDVLPEQTEYLTPGDVRPILPGTAGLLHSLFHLENPSVTLVVRTPGLSAHQPQMTLLPPHFAYSEADMDRDRRIKMITRLLQTSRDIDGTSWTRLLCDKIPELDFLSLLAVTARFHRSIDSDDVRQGFHDNVARVHGTHRAAQLADTVREIRRVDNLRAARRGTDDENLRFFLAVLMNTRDRDGILAILARRFPGQDPVKKCAAFLDQLCNQKKETGRLLAALSARAGVREYMLGSKLAGLVPPGAIDRAAAWFHDLLIDSSAGDSTDRVQRITTQLPELAPLFPHSRKTTEQ